MVTVEYGSYTQAGIIEKLWLKSLFWNVQIFEILFYKLI